MSTTDPPKTKLKFSKTSAAWEPAKDTGSTPALPIPTTMGTNESTTDKKSSLTYKNQDFNPNQAQPIPTYLPQPPFVPQMNNQYRYPGPPFMQPPIFNAPIFSMMQPNPMNPGMNFNPMTHLGNPYQPQPQAQTFLPTSNPIPEKPALKLSKKIRPETDTSATPAPVTSAPTVEQPVKVEAEAKPEVPKPAPIKPAEEDEFRGLPTERPKKIVYSRKMIADFIDKEKSTVHPKDDEFEDLAREITITQKGPSSYKSNRPPGGTNFVNEGGYNDRKYPNRTQTDKYPSGGKKYESNYGSGYNNSQVAAAPKPLPVIQRLVLTEDEKKKLDDIKKDADGWIQHQKANENPDLALKKEINLTLFKLTQENFNEIYQALIPFTETLETTSLLVGLLIDKAWAQAKYTSVFAQMTSDIGKVDFKWFVNMTPEQKLNLKEPHVGKEPLKIYKELVLQKIKKEFMNGFTAFIKTITEAENKAEYNVEDKVSVYQKSKSKVLANMSFISELYKRKYLSHKVMKIISNMIITNFVKLFCSEETKTNSYPISEVYLEALFRILEMTGEALEKKDRSADQEFEPAVLQSHKAKSEELVKILMGSINAGNFSEEDQKRYDEKGGAKSDMNNTEFIFSFLRQLIRSNKCSKRLESLIENTLELRKNGWKMKDAEPASKKQQDEYRDDRRGYKGRKDDGYDYYGGSKGSKYNDDEYYTEKRGGSNYDEYEKKSSNKGGREEYVAKKEPETKKKSEASSLGEVKAMLDNLKTSEVWEDYTDIYSKDNGAISDFPVGDLFRSTLKCFTNCSAKVAEVRNKIPGLLVQNFGLKEAEFFSEFSRYSERLFGEDIPFLKKLLGQVLALSVADSNFKIDSWAPIWSEEEDDREEQKFFYIDLIDEAVKYLKSLSKESLIDGFTKFSASKLK
jgi:hypothetical protein